MAKTKFALSDFKDGAVPGVILLAACRNRALLEPVKQWIAEGKLVSPTPNADPLADMWWTADSPRMTATSTPEPPQRRQASYARAKPEPEQHRWPYLCGQAQKRADDQDLNDWVRTGGVIKGKSVPRPAPTPNPCINFTGQLWQAGYDGQPEPKGP